jgi:hypothetical protein
LPLIVFDLFRFQSSLFSKSLLQPSHHRHRQFHLQIDLDSQTLLILQVLLVILTFFSLNLLQCVLKSLFPSPYGLVWLFASRDFFRNLERYQPWSCGRSHGLNHVFMVCL